MQGGRGPPILATLRSNGVAGRTSARVSTIVWDWKMKMWGNLGTGPAAELGLVPWVGAGRGGARAGWGMPVVRCWWGQCLLPLEDQGPLARLC